MKKEKRRTHYLTTFSPLTHSIWAHWIASKYNFCEHILKNLTDTTSLPRPVIRCVSGPASSAHHRSHSTTQPPWLPELPESLIHTSVNMGGRIQPLMSASKVLKWECLPLKIRGGKTAQLKDAFGSTFRHTQGLWFQGILFRTSFISPQNF